MEVGHTIPANLYELAPVGSVTVSQSGLIVEASFTAATLLGMEPSALVGRLFSASVLDEDQDAYSLARKTLLATGEAQAFSVRMIKKDGTAFWAYLVATATQAEDGCRVLLSDLSQRKQLEDCQRFLATTHGGRHAEPFFDMLARYLAQSLGMDFICIDRLEGDGLTARTVSVWCNGNFQDNLSYALKDTPCGDVVGKDVCCFPASVCQYFPRDQVLQELQAESYIGVTLWGHTHQPIGLIAAIGHRPLANRALAEAILKLVEPRAAWELERLDGEEALRRSNDRLTLALDVGRAGTWEWRLEDDTVTFDARFHAMLGYAPDELPSALTDWLPYHHPQDLPLMMAKADAYLRGDSPDYESEHRIRGREGGWEWVFTRGLRVKSSGTGEPERFFGIAMNVSQRKRAEEALLLANERLQHFVDANIVGILVASPAGSVLEANDYYLNLVGFTRAEFKAGKVDWRAITPPEWLPADQKAIQELRQRGKCTPYEKEYVRRDGTRVPVLLVDAMLPGPEERIAAFALDLSERKQAEAALRESEEKHRLLVQNLHDGVVVHAPDTSIVLANDMASRLLGLSLDQMTGKMAIDPAWSFVHEDLTQVPLDEYPVNRVLATRKPIQDVVLGVNRPGPGDRVWLLVNAFPEFGADEGLRQVVVTFVDISERLHAEAERVKLESQLKQAQKMESVGRLAGGVAHDFNNILSVILGYTESAMEQVGPGEPIYADLEEVFKAATRSADLTRQLLAFARRQTVIPKVLDLNEILVGLLKMLRRLIGENIQLDWHPGAALWRVWMDPSQIDQIMANLCINARDAIADTGTVTIETANRTVDDLHCAGHPDFAPGEYVMLSVSDDGCGINQEALERIFEPFFTTKEVGKGTGLGLATVYGIAKQNNGFIDVSSEVGKGSTFRVYLPRDAGRATNGQPAGVPEPPTRRGAEVILLAEDDPVVLKLTARILEHLGYTVLAAGTPSEALRLAREHTGEIAMLLTDVIMPEMNGLELARNLLSVYPQLKRMFMSGYTADVIAQHRELDADTYFIQKPFSKEDLAAKVRQVLDGA